MTGTAICARCRYMRRRFGNDQGRIVGLSIVTARAILCDTCLRVIEDIHFERAKVGQRASKTRALEVTNHAICSTCSRHGYVGH